jgi:hypothetical protein
MRTLLYAAIAASVLGAPIITIAQQPNAPVTRTQVRTELLQLEQAGYKPSANDSEYPGNIQAAEARVAAQNSGYGAGTAGTSESGSQRVPANARGPVDTQPVYFGQ